MRQRLDRSGFFSYATQVRQPNMVAVWARALLWLLIVATPLLTLALSARAMNAPPARAFEQVSPLSPLTTSSPSPLAAPSSLVAQPATIPQNSTVSIYLVGIVLMSMLVVAMVVWRRR